MAKRLIKLLIGIIILLILTDASYAKPLILVTDEWPPLVYDNGTKGMLVEILKEAFAEEKIPIEIRSYPAARMFDFMRKKYADAALAPLKTKEREGYLYYPNEPLFLGENVLFYIKSRNYKNRKDLEGLRIGTLIGYAYNPKFQKDAKESIIDSTARDEIQLFKKLMAGRVDMALEQKLVGYYWIKQLKPSQPIDYISRGYTTVNYLAFSKKPENLYYMKKYDSGMRKIKKNGKYQKIIDKYNKLYGVKQ